LCADFDARCFVTSSAFTLLLLRFEKWRAAIVTSLRTRDTLFERNCNSPRLSVSGCPFPCPRSQQINAHKAEIHSRWLCFDRKAGGGFPLGNQATLYTDLLNRSLSNVNRNEIVSTYTQRSRVR